MLGRASKTPTGKQRRAKDKGFPLGGHNKSVTWVRERADNAIAFTLYSTDVVTWHPDNSVEIDNYGTVTTSRFAERFLPAGVHLHHPVYRRGGVSGGANTIGFRTAAEDEGYRSAICQGDVVRFQPIADDLWLPDESTCYDLCLPIGVDRRKARELSKYYNLRDFEAWLSMAPIALASGGDRIEHNDWELDICMEALEARNFRLAAEHLPLVKDTGAYGTELKPLPITTSRFDEHITASSLSRLKLAMWREEGVLRTETRTAWDRSDWDRGMRRVKELTRLGVDVRGLGPVT